MSGRRVAAIVLAAGESSRMVGRFKLLRPISGEAMVRLPVSAALGAGLDPVFVVVGHRSTDVRQSLADLPIRVLENPDYPEGVATSVRVALDALKADRAIEAAVILLGDEPGVRTETILRVLDEWRDSGAGAIRVEYRDRLGHPVLIDRSAFADLDGLEGDRGLRDRLFGSGTEACHVFLDEDAPIDVDTEEAFHAAVARLQQ
jgi:molybdenum cofactor cytidylyltransferase